MGQRAEERGATASVLDLTTLEHRVNPSPTSIVAHLREPGRCALCHLPLTAPSMLIRRPSDVWDQVCDRCGTEFVHSAWRGIVSQFELVGPFNSDDSIPF